MIENTIVSRSATRLNTEPYSRRCLPEFVAAVDVKIPLESCYVLRMLIRRPFGDYRVPMWLSWVRPLIHAAQRHQDENGLDQPFVYLTIRSGVVVSTGDDQWHVDGFSVAYSHLPEQNYIWSDRYATEVYGAAIPIPDDFDPRRHNLHKFFQGRAKPEYAESLYSRVLYVIDPYVIHRRPAVPVGERRCFVRVSFTPVEIEDVNNTPNPLLPTNYTRDGVREFRDLLVDYDSTKTAVDSRAEPHHNSQVTSREVFA